jgi:hypothetical protein
MSCTAARLLLPGGFGADWPNNFLALSASGPRFRRAGVNMPKPKSPKNTEEGAKKDPVASADSSPGTATPNVAPELSVTVAGAEHIVRRALSAMRFAADEWNHAVTRQIAIDETLVPGAGLDDTLGGDKIRMFSQDVRDLYRQRCINDATRRGHAVPNPGDIPADSDTTIMEVGDALFDHSVH